MTNKGIVTPLTLGCLAFVFLALQQTPAQAADCPPGQTDQLKHYKGTCMDPKQIDPQTGRLREATSVRRGRLTRSKITRELAWTRRK